MARRDDGGRLLRDAGVSVWVPSYRRGGLRCSTQAYLPWARMVVSESEVEAYRESGHEVEVCPDRVQGNLCRVRNWILDRELPRSRCVILLDDDYSFIGRWNGRSQWKLSAFDVARMMVQGTVLAEDCGAFLWGLNCIVDKQAYRECNPFGFVQYIGGPFQAHRMNPIRYDEEIPLKEDYDMTLQHLNVYRQTLRLNAFHYQVKQNEQQGGCATYRNREREVEQFKLLQKKWGTRIVTPDRHGRARKTRRKQQAYDINPVLRVPIPGV